MGREREREGARASKLTFWAELLNYTGVKSHRGWRQTPIDVDRSYMIAVFTAPSA